MLSRAHILVRRVRQSIDQCIDGSVKYIIFWMVISATEKVKLSKQDRNVVILHKVAREGLCDKVTGRRLQDQGYGLCRDLGKEFQAEETLSAQASGQECAWLVPGRVRMSKPEEETGKEAGRRGNEVGKQSEAQHTVLCR